ncbi:MAG: hypothetical protein Ta2B_01520 [Termitinemataceae bacterium]|nr:MAG: hypothetical protein Ta2B_01520 [Termitinemataceae bacterium]
MVIYKMSCCVKKSELEKAGYDVRNGGKSPYNILTLNGDISLNRTILRVNLQDKATGENQRDEVSVLDEYFKIKELPHIAGKRKSKGNIVEIN